MTVGRHRWVEYASKNRYNASQVPPEWHGWLHHITDHTGDEVDYQLRDIWKLRYLVVIYLIPHFDDAAAAVEAPEIWG